MLRWPDRGAVHRAVRAWAQTQSRAHPEIRRIGYFGSYARGDWGVGSDIDLLIVVDDATKPFARRSLAYDASNLPVPADVLVYTRAEWDAMATAARGPARTGHPIEWLLARDAGSLRD